MDVGGNAKTSGKLTVGTDLNVTNTTKTNTLMVGTTIAPAGSEKLYVLGDTKLSGNLNVNSNVKANTYLYNSDRRYKSAIAPLDNALDKVLALNGYSYFNKLSAKTDIGVIAQEVEKVFPDLVHTDAEGYKSVEYANLVAPLIEAVKELNDKVDSLEARLSALEAK